MTRASRREKQAWTYEEFMERPEDLNFYELWDGKLRKPPSSSVNHQHLVGNLLFGLHDYLKLHPIGHFGFRPFDVRLNPDRAEACHPDLYFITQERAGILVDRWIQGAPDLVVEVLALDTAAYDLGHKKRAYQAAGVLEYWAIWEDLERVEVYRQRNDGQYGSPELLEAGDTLTTALLPGFTLVLDDLYSDLPFPCAS